MTIAWFATGALASLDPSRRAELLSRRVAFDDGLRASCSKIMADVRTRGDDALREMARAFDGVELRSVEVPESVWRSAVNRIDPETRRVIERAARNIATVHEAQRPQPFEVLTADGVIVGQRPDPLDRVGIYAPGGRATYPSSVLMGAVPARAAGVREIIVCSPPGHSGVPADVVLAAAAIGGASRVFALGGAGAIAAMAYGTESVPRVDRIVGPGNEYVAMAKLLASSHVGIDSPAGPSELLVIADEAASPMTVAREVIAQAEHDPKAAVVVVATSASWAGALQLALAELMPSAPRAAIVRESLARAGALLVAPAADASAFATEYAPEHLLLAVAAPQEMLASIRNAGTVFLGETSSVSFGDYMTGGNHVLPTGGLARAYSGLSVREFVRWMTYQRVDAGAAARLADDTGHFADVEGLPGHAAAARQWRTE